MLLKRSIVALALALLVIAPVTALAQTPAESAYQVPETMTTPANAPVIPPATPAAVEPTAQAPAAGQPVPVAAPVKAAPVAVTPVADQTADESGSTLPVTGFEALLLVAIACIATAAGFALRAASR